MNQADFRRDMCTFRTHFTFRVDTWTQDGESIVEHVAGRRLPRMAGGQAFAGGRGAQDQITVTFLPSVHGG